MNYRVLMPSLCMLSVSLCGPGCVSQTGPGRLTVRLENRQEYLQFWRQCVDTVRSFGFRLDRVDPSAGVITTYPETSKQWFEFWRRDVQGADELLEASLHTVRRKLAVRVTPAGEPHRYRVTAEATVERLSLPERQVTASSAALQAFGSRLPTAEGEIEGPQARGHWVLLGRDGRLERAVLGEILRRWPGARTAAQSQPATRPTSQQ